MVCTYSLFLGSETGANCLEETFLLIPPDANGPSLINQSVVFPWLLDLRFKFRIVNNICQECAECIVYFLTIFCATLETRYILLVSQNLHGIFIYHHLIDQVTLVTHNNNLCIDLTILLHLVEPITRMLKAFLICDIVHQNDTCCLLVLLIR